MNKKLNTVLFLLGATVLNLLIMLVLVVILGAVAVLATRSMEEVNQAVSMIAVIVILFGSIAGTFFIYNRLIKWVVVKWDLEKYIEPVFRGSRRR